ncbi:acetyl-CoA acetyltransferase [Actinoplanes lutulentus]|uniref:Acetyl-CoA acetyltransferase n=1 Tax=Actinoplanes lutulentus TaxID=1287878 RepID=A0A327ZLZ8_9ACTN|nr:lipid-transfer protein [Actinoplanes lutulentus]MBB2941122.1 acetyl-CoA acetyltransferase [Actinoplanes lutulentus]RAK43431.1 acetyl-CoA acetyltransferase [Actinoplanes lutulentus]
MSDVAIIGFARSDSSITTSGVETLVPVFEQALAQAGLGRQEIDFWCSGSSDYLAGRAFSFVNAVDAIGAVPPISESHVEMDAAWALYEAYLKILAGEAETALVYGFGKASAGDLSRVLALQLDPYTVAPLWPDSISVAALQARLALEAGLFSERDMAVVAARDSGVGAGELLGQAYLRNPLRTHDVARVLDGAAAVVLAGGERARRGRADRSRPAWITGIAHRIDPQGLGERDLTTVPSAALAAADAGFDGEVDVVALHAPFTHQELLLRAALPDGRQVRILPDNGQAMFSAGLSRIGAAAEEIMSGRAETAAAHATSGPALQQNLVCVLAAAETTPEAER